MVSFPVNAFNPRGVDEMLCTGPPDGYYAVETGMGAASAAGWPEQPEQHDDSEQASKLPPSEQAEESLQDEDEEKVEKRRRNAAAARKSRQKRKEEVESLRAELEQTRARNRELENFLGQFHAAVSDNFGNDSDLAKAVISQYWQGLMPLLRK
ncbi:predicted protein [Uncinocarpus reesii 1704]|uniref:BZIP domain-containing protein n=1 Tax=Uncinocarpus reesii (strain UAMH 1704) TaxID=336963 RepID=C4JRH7_UNCRE|nr:uncharacterized protein UREG_05066 [Uncinocarpus reesii 1704]EEP80224.1 predicted protein [Uncinocarpus reesii 1704]